MSFSIDKLPQLESHLANNQYVSGQDKPNAQDVELFQAFQAKKSVPEQNKFPNTYAWFGWLNMFNPEKLQSFGGSAKKAAPAKKEAPAKKDEDVDLFGSDDDDEMAAEAAAEERRAKVAAAHKAKVNKQAVVGRTLFQFDVKVFEIEQDLIDLGNRIYKEMKMEGLEWLNAPKTEKIAFGMSKLIVACRVVDDLCAQDDIIEMIQEGREEEIQSVDVNSMSKV